MKGHKPSVKLKGLLWHMASHGFYSSHVLLFYFMFHFQNEFSPTGNNVNNHRTKLKITQALRKQKLF